MQKSSAGAGSVMDAAIGAAAERALQGDFAGAREALQSALKSAAGDVSAAAAAGAELALAELWLFEGRAAEAEGHLATAETLLRGLEGAGVFVARWHALRGRACELRGHAENAARAYAEASDSARATGAPPVGPSGTRPGLTAEHWADFFSSPAGAVATLDAAQSEHEARAAELSGQRELAALHRLTAASARAADGALGPAVFQAGQARSLAVAARHPLLYTAASLMVADLEEARGDRVAAYGALVRAAVSLVDLLGAGADAPINDKLSELRARWGEASYRQAALAFIAARKAETSTH